MRNAINARRIATAAAPTAIPAMAPLLSFDDPIGVSSWRDAVEDAPAADPDVDAVPVERPVDEVDVPSDDDPSDEFAVDVASPARALSAFVKESVAADDAAELTARFVVAVVVVADTEVDRGTAVKSPVMLAERTDCAMSLASAGLRLCIGFLMVSPLNMHGFFSSVEHSSQL